MEAVAISVSTCTAPALHGQHSFMVFDYSLNKELGLGEFIRSKTFNVGRFDWSIRYYPDGVNGRCKEYISMFLELMTQGAQVRARFSFRILVGHSQPLEWTTGQTCLVNQEASKRCTYGWEKFIEKKGLEASAELLVHNCIAIDCHIVVLKEGPLVSGSVDVPSPIVIPPSELSNDFGKLLESKEGADITFLVKGEAFPSHKMVRVARSPVFKVLFCGSMMENVPSHIAVENKEPIVFEALLRFIYTNALMSLEDFDYRSANEMIFHLLHAADWYGMEKLKIICEMKLCKTIDVERVIIALLLADQHKCDMLKHTCLYFLATPNIMEKVMETADYNELKILSPSLLLELLESVKI